jgi:amino-acid N-acetyltransferase
LIRKATLQEVTAIYKLVMDQARDGHLLPRAMSDLYDQVRDFSVYTDDVSGEIVGCGALHIVWDDLAEIRSLAVDGAHQGKGIGTRLIEALLEEAGSMGAARVFVLTYRPPLFERLGFEVIDKAQLPHKIWADCIRCTKFPECDEIALVRSP